MIVRRAESKPSGNLRKQGHLYRGVLDNSARAASLWFFPLVRGVCSSQ